MPVALGGRAEIGTPHDGDRRPAYPVRRFEKGHEYRGPKFCVEFGAGAVVI